MQNADVLMKQGMQTMGRKDDPPQGYGAPLAVKPKEEMKTMAMAGTGIINS